MDSRPIGVFDTGLGGLTAVKELLERLPHEDIIFFGDTSRVPYGTRSKDIIIKYARQSMRFLRTFDIKLAVIACGTVSSTALDAVTAELDLPVVGVVESSTKRAAEATKNGCVGIIATTASINSGFFEKYIRQYKPDCRCVSKACPLLVPLVENGRFSRGDAVAEQVVSEYLAPVRAAGVDTLILGCTHYPLLAGIIGDYMGPKVTLIDSGCETARYVETLLKVNGTQNAQAKNGFLRCYVSDEPESFSQYGGMFLGREIRTDIHKIDIESY